MFTVLAKKQDDRFKGKAERNMYGSQFFFYEKAVASFRGRVESAHVQYACNQLCCLGEEAVWQLPVEGGEDWRVRGLLL